MKQVQPVYDEFMWIDEEIIFLSNDRGFLGEDCLDVARMSEMANLDVA